LSNPVDLQGGLLDDEGKYPSTEDRFSRTFFDT